MLKIFRQISALTITVFFFLAQSVSAAKLNSDFTGNLSYYFSAPDSVHAADTLKSKEASTKPKPDSLALIKAGKLVDPGTPNETFTANDIKYSDYRYAGSFFDYMPFGTLKNLGQTGQPAEASIYGLGYNNVTFMNDGMVLNNRLQNSFDVYNIPDINLSEIEIIPLTRGFLYGAVNNSAAVNFIPVEELSGGSYSRIRYYQAQNSEGYFSADYRTKASRRIGIEFRLTNHSADSLYDNSDFSHWNGGVSLLYMLSDKVNIKASYDYLQNNIHLNGGIDADSISNTYPANQFSEILYDNLAAPVRFADRYMKNTGHDLQLKMLGKIFNEWQSDVTLYYKSNLQEFRQNDLTTDTGGGTNPKIKNDNKYSTFGMRMRQSISIRNASLDLIGGYEHTKFNTDLIAGSFSRNSLYVSGILSFNLIDSVFKPSVYSKIVNYSGNNSIGAGGDLTINFSDNLKIYSGLSVFKRQQSIFEELFSSGVLNHNASDFKFMEISLRYLGDFFSASCGYIHQSSSAAQIPILLESLPLKEDNIVFTKLSDISLNAYNISLGLRIWNIHLTSNTSYYPTDSDRFNYQMPEFTSVNGLYYIDTLFSKNLFIKTGFNFKWYGARPHTVTDFQKGLSAAEYISVPIWSSVMYSGNEAAISNSLISPSGQLDFFLAGTVQKYATIYFVFENLLDSQYYVSSYYPMPGRGIRLGVTWDFLD